MEPRLILNQIKTPDGTILTSRHVHDYVVYKDKNGLVLSVDGGNDYLKRGVGFEPTYCGLSNDEINYINDIGLIYNPTTGRFYDKNNKLRDTAIDADGYRHVIINNKAYKAHRLVFMFSGIKNIIEVDHIDNDRTNNIWTNLRLVSKIENQANSLIRKDNTSNVKGLSFHKTKKYWVGRVQSKGIRYEIYSKIKEVAISKLIELRKSLHKEYANNGESTNSKKEFYTEMSLYTDSPFNEIRERICRGGRGKDGKQPLTWTPLCEMNDEWLKACIQYNIDRDQDGYMNELYRKEIKYRNDNGIVINE